MTKTRRQAIASGGDGPAPAAAAIPSSSRRIPAPTSPRYGPPTRDILCADCSRLMRSTGEDGIRQPRGGTIQPWLTCLRTGIGSPADGDKSAVVLHRQVRLSWGVGWLYGEVKPPNGRWQGRWVEDRNYRRAASAGGCRGRCDLNRLAELRYAQRCVEPECARLGWRTDARPQHCQVISLAGVRPEARPRPGAAGRRLAANILG